MCNCWLQNPGGCSRNKKKKNFNIAKKNMMVTNCILTSLVENVVQDVQTY